MQSCILRLNSMSWCEGAAMDESSMIYAITFHVKPGRKVHTFWFTDKQRALTFLESVKDYPKTLDYSTMQIPVNEVIKYDGVIQEGRIMPIEMN